MLGDEAPLADDLLSITRLVAKGLHMVLLQYYLLLVLVMEDLDALVLHLLLALPEET